MPKIDPNAPAFPQEYSTFEYKGDPAFVKETRVYHRVSGLTIRQEFAKAAMQGLLADGATGWPLQQLASAAVMSADAVIAELEKEKTP